MSLAITSRSIAPIVSRVFTRKKGSPGFSTTGSLTGWTLEPNLRCLFVRHEAGPGLGSARFDYVPLNQAQIAIEFALSAYTTDDQVKVVADPIAGTDPPDAHVLFEGVLGKHALAVNSDASGASESVGFVAQPLALADNDHPDHAVTGPWFPVPLATPSDPEPEEGREVFVLENPMVPAVFNFRGRPNRAATRKIQTTVGNGNITMRAHTFAEDGRLDAEYWTVGDALAALLVVRLYGTTGHALDRHVDITGDLAVQLAYVGNPEDRPAQFAGLDAVLPEVSVHGLGVLDAVAHVCEAGGFDVSVLPVPPEDVTSLGYDRRFYLNVWRRDQGEAVTLDLAPRGSAYATAQEAVAANNVENLNGQRDGAAVVNTVLVNGPTYIECRLPLKPLWDPDDFFTGEPDESFASPTEEDLDDPDAYAGRHVTGGVAFDRYGHVGRAWGLDCTGERALSLYTEPELYVHDEAGFDFVAELELDNASGPAAAAITERTASGVTEPIRWTRRVRHALPMRSPQAIARGIKYFLEVSEDAGATWAPTRVQITSLSRQFGIYLNIGNLAAVNKLTQGAGVTPEPADSWWAKIKDGELTFRLTCTVEADHATRFIAARQPTSGSVYDRAQYVPISAEEVLVQNDTVFNPLTSYIKVSGYLPGDGTSDPITAARDAAERRRDALEDARVSLAASTWIMDFTRYRIGDVVTKVRGREYPLAAGGGSLPNIVGITYQLNPPGNQSIELTLSDNVFAGVGPRAERGVRL